MQTEAIFENIANRIIREIINANKTIYIAVAWFTNKTIYEQLLLKSKQGCKIQIIISNDEINENSAIDFELLEKSNGKVYKIGNGDTELMHNKFCVIDYNTVITGSYNWSYKAESKFENIVINSNDTALAEQFVKEFNQIKRKYYPNETNLENDFPLDKIIKRLEIIKNFIILEDIDDVKNETQKLNEYQFNNDIEAIVEAVNKKEYATAISIIQKFILTYQQLAIWNDPEIAGIRLEIKLLESQINAFDNEKIELEKVLSDFQHRHTLELGTLILEVLKLRKIKYKNHKKEAEAEKDYNSYSNQFETEKEKHQFELNEEEKQELKKNFRKATTLCHPDKVSEEQKVEAEMIFIALKKAYDEHDITKVNQILNDLQTGNSFASQTDSITEKEKLIIALQKLKQKLKQLEKDIIQLKESETFETINNITNWDDYFKETKTQLEQELQNLTLELEN
jgi:PLD-like domain